MGAVETVQFILATRFRPAVMLPRMMLNLHPSEPAWIDALMEGWEAIGGEALAARGTFHVALSGGSTPATFYRALARSKWPWSATQLYIGDERCVSPDHKDSNFKMIYEAFYPVKPNLHRWKTELGDYARAALDYEHLIKRETGDPPRFDLVLLGIGEDGHTASLFPGTTGLKEETRMVVLNPVPQLKTKRLTFTYPALRRARRIWFLSRGNSKRPYVDKMAAGQGASFPAGGVVCDTAPPVIHHCLV
jgi:6-phosphogluconolactonase